MKNKCKKWSATSVIALFLIMLGLGWLGILLVLFLLIYKITFFCIPFIKYTFLRKTLKALFLMVFIFTVAISTKLLAFDIFKIPSASMENTLYTNDVILVNKLTYGPKLPQSPFEIPWVNIAFYLNEKAKSRINDTWWSYNRLSGISEIKKGDIFVFDMDFGDHITTIVKRCMGTPGSTLEVKRGDVFIDGKEFSPSNQIKNKYWFKVKDRKELPTSDSLGIDMTLRRDLNNPKWSKGTLSKLDKEKLIKTGLIDSIHLVLDTIAKKGNLYPYSKFTQWNLDRYGPYKIPYKGMTIELTHENYALYKSVLKKHEKVEIEEKEGGFYIKDKGVTSYTFKENYYFMMGDNRKGSMDSRYWGVVPEKFIVGKVVKILFSNHEDKFQWSRFFKTVK